MKTKDSVCCVICSRKLRALNSKFTTQDNETICRQCLMISSFDYKPKVEVVKWMTLSEVKEKIEKDGDRIVEDYERSKKDVAEGKIKSCPYCHSKNIDFMQNKRKNFSVGKAAAGTVLTGGIGVIAGFAGKDGENQWHCKNCGQIFETKD